MKSLKPGHHITKILLFRTHHLWNSTTELILIYNDFEYTRCIKEMGFHVNLIPFPRIISFFIKYYLKKTRIWVSMFRRIECTFLSYNQIKVIFILRQKSLPDCFRIAIRLTSKCHQIVVRLTSNCGQVMVRLWSGCSQIFVRLSSDCCHNALQRSTFSEFPILHLGPTSLIHHYDCGGDARFGESGLRPFNGLVSH